MPFTAFCLVILLSLAPNAFVYAENTVLIALSSTDSPPYKWHNNRGELEGLIPDMHKQLFADLNYKVKFIEVSFFDPKQWSDTATRLKAGEIDIIGPLIIPPDGLPELTIAKVPMLKVKMGVYFLNGKQFPIPNYNSLKNHTGVVLGAGLPVISSSGPDTGPIVNLVFKPNIPEVIDLLRSGEAEYWYSPTYAANAYTHSQKLRSKLIASPFQRETFIHLVTNQTNTNQSMLDKIDKLILEMNSSGKVERLKNYHLNKYVTYFKARH